jgi:hypothetical protein
MAEPSSTMQSLPGGHLRRDADSLAAAAKKKLELKPTTLHVKRKLLCI